MNRKERRELERKFEKERRRQERLERLFEEGYDIVRAGGWPSWSQLVEIHGPGSKFCQMVGCDQCFVNSRYQVIVKFEEPGGRWWPPLVHLSVKAHDKRCVHDWRDLQRIKNELVGTDAEAVELYPAEARLMDEANQFHLYCTPSGLRFPFGTKERTRSTQADLDEEFSDQDPRDRPQQREFEDHHDVQGCTEGGLIEWPYWAKEWLERLLSDPSRVEPAGGS